MGMLNSPDISLSCGAAHARRLGEIETSEPFARGRTDRRGSPRVGVLAGRCAEILRSALGLSAQVTLTAPGSLPRSEGGKLRRVRDERTLA
jgi:phenylacetate-coenzyme A ligase PaaK-like adenylate-forming protein